MLGEAADNPNPAIKEKFDALMSTYEGPMKNVHEIMKHGFGALDMKAKTQLKNHMKVMTPGIVDLFNAYKELGLALPTGAKFKGRDLKSIKAGDMDSRLESGATSPESKKPTGTETITPEPKKLINPTKAKPTPEPTEPSTSEKAGTIVFDKKGDLPVDTLNGLPFESVKDIVGNGSDFFKGIKDKAIDEPPPTGVTSSGIILMEPDGRMWIREVTGHYGGYEHSFSKGKLEKGLSVQPNALKEVFEETGMLGEIVGHLDDAKGDTGVTRFYVGRRIAGSPKDAGWETDNVKLVDPAEANKTEDGKGFLNKNRDKALADKIKSL